MLETLTGWPNYIIWWWGGGGGLHWLETTTKISISESGSQHHGLNAGTIPSPWALSEQVYLGLWLLGKQNSGALPPSPGCTQSWQWGGIRPLKSSGHWRCLGRLWASGFPCSPLSRCLSTKVVRFPFLGCRGLCLRENAPSSSSTHCFTSICQGFQLFSQR